MEFEMAEITASLVKELREKTGAGMMDCKKALNEVAGDLEKAVDWLRTKGLSAASKKAGRVAAEGRERAWRVGWKRGRKDSTWGLRPSRVECWRSQSSVR